MSAGIASIALFAPIVASNAIFSCRRASRGVDSIEENPAYALANIDIAAAQTLKAARAVKAISIATNSQNEEFAKGASDAIRNLSNTNKVMNGVGKVIKFTADHINPVICVTSGIKVLGSDDKIEAAARETLALTSMFAAEKGAKIFIGMPYTEKINGKTISYAREGLYKKIFEKEQLKAVSDFCATKKAMKFVPGGLKGLFFAGASIVGYKLGSLAGEKVIGVEKQAN